MLNALVAGNFIGCCDHRVCGVKADAILDGAGHSGQVLWFLFCLVDLMG